VRLVRWVFASGFRLMMLIAVLVFGYHLWGELSLLEAAAPSFLQRLELTALDAKFAHRGDRPPERWQVAVAAADERSIQLLGRVPWSREVHARLVSKLTELDAAVIAYDITFADASGDAERRVVEAVRTTAATSGLYEARADLEEGAPIVAQAAAQAADSPRPRLSALADGLQTAAEGMQGAGAAIERFRAALDEEVKTVNPDTVFAKAVRASERVVFPLISYSKLEADAVGTDALARSLSLVASSTISEVVTVGDDGLLEVHGDVAPHFDGGLYRSYFGVQAPVPVLAKATEYLATINALPDVDGVIRRMALVSNVAGSGSVLPTLALQSVAVVEDMPIEILAAPEDLMPSGIQVGNFMLDTELGGTVTIDWYGDLVGSGLPMLSIADVLEGRVSRDEVEGRIIFVAVTAIGTHDLRATPVAGFVPGVFVHATLAQNIVDGKQLLRPSYVIGIELVVMLMIGIIAGVVLSRLGAFGQLIGALMMAAAWLSFDRYVLFERGFVVHSVLPTVQIFISLLGIASWKFLREARERRRTKQAFARYLAPAVMEQVLAHPEEYLKLGGRRYDATVLFSDIRGFTTMSENLSPEELGDLLNRYMTPMTGLVFETDGTLDKYIGDAVMAFWGAPLPGDDHPVQACRCALAMMKKVDELNVEFAEHGLPQIAIGIGLSTGPMTIGNMGSDEFFAYTALGDRVNLGARLEGQTKSYGVGVIISEDCYTRVKGAMACRELGAIKVKGKNEPVRIYELIDEGPLGAHAQFVDAFHEGLVAFRSRRWDEAITAFTAAVDRRPGDKTSLDYITECTELKAHPPPEDWDGIHVATSK